MSSDWEWVTLDKLGAIKIGKPYEIRFSYLSIFKEKIPFVGVKEVGKNRLFINKCERYYGLNSLKNKNNYFKKDTVCVSIYGSFPGDSAILKIDSFLSISVFAVVLFKNVADKNFIKYCFDFSRIRKKIYSSSATVTIRKSFPLNKLLKINFPKPSLEIQQKIGNILANYDLILDNHEKQIKLLKELKKSLFREWFIKLRFPGDYESYGARGGYLKVEQGSK